MGLANNSTFRLKPPLDMTLRLKLSVMMFLQFAIWGSWFVVLGNYLAALNPDKFTNSVIGSIYGTMALGSIFAPMIVGQIADRFFSSEKLMAVLHLVGAGLLYWMGQITDPTTFWMVALAFALVYSPTLALSNSIAFSHVPDANRDFAGLRVLGTAGWIAANWAVGWLLALKTGEGAKLLPNAPFLLGAACSVLLGVFSFILPHTPPPGKAGSAFPFLKAVGLLRQFSFGVFFGVSFVITIVLAFYYGFTGLYLEKGVGRAAAEVGQLTTLGQFAELILLPFLPWFLKRFGMKWVLALGMLSWGVRYFLFSYCAYEGAANLFPLVLVGIALHGVCFDFFFAAGFIHVDNKAPSDIRGSAQALFTFLTYGVGMWIGNIVSGELAQHYTNPTTNQVDWASFWFVPAIGVMICFVVFVLFFRDTNGSKEGAKPQAA